MSTFNIQYSIDRRRAVYPDCTAASLQPQTASVVTSVSVCTVCGSRVLIAKPLDDKGSHEVRSFTLGAEAASLHSILARLVEALSGLEGYLRGYIAT